MASEVSFVRKKKHPGFMTLLSSAACEWFLIFLLFLDAVFSYLLAKFAHYCELQVPCPLCSRLDRVFEKKKSGFCWSSVLCGDHKEEISSLMSCYIHGKLTDVHGICEECILSIAMKNKSNSESCRSPVERSVVQNLMLNKNIKLGSSGRRISSYCNKSGRAKSNAERLLELNPVGLGASKANVKPPLPRLRGCSHSSRRDSMKRLRDKAHQPAGSNSVDTLSHVGYAKLKISSDSELEIPSSEDDDDDDGITGSSGNYYIKPDCVVEFGRRYPPKTPANNVASEKQTHQGSELKDEPDLLDLDEPKNVNSSPSDAFLDHGLRELNWTESYCKPNPPFTAELMSLDDVPLPPDLGLLGASAATSNFSLPHTSAPSALSNKLNESRKDEDSSCEALPLSASLRSNDSSYESLDGISVSDIEGESIVDRLRQQVEHNRSCMNSLYKELEKERNAAAVAANQAMAMITRLQEEKAALHMEAVQYLRMMEEQAVYDMEALERANYLLAEKEKELQDLEAELEFYRSNFHNESGIEDVRKETSVLENHIAASSENNPGTSCDPKSAKIPS